MSLVQKALLLVVGVGIAGACVLVANWARRPQMALLFGHLPVLILPDAAPAFNDIHQFRHSCSSLQLDFGNWGIRKLRD